MRGKTTLPQVADARGPRRLTSKEIAMKWHKYFAWASVACMALALYAGYKRA